MDATARTRVAASVSLYLLLFSTALHAGLSCQVRGPWRFRMDAEGVGLEEKWFAPSHSDGDWKTSRGPGDGARTIGRRKGVGWYRVRVTVPKTWDGKDLVLILPSVDDSDITFFNGKRVGGMERAHNLARSYGIPGDLVRAGNENVLAIRVLNLDGPGGINGGTTRLATLEPCEATGPDQDTISLAGLWRFLPDRSYPRGARASAKNDWEKPSYDDRSWGAIEVGKPWEAQGLPFDGIAWYRRQVRIPKEWKGSPIGLRLGTPDDAAEVYFNGESLGKRHHLEPMSFRLEDRLIRFGELNTISVRVRDWYRGGGLVGSGYLLSRLAPFKAVSKAAESDRARWYERGRARIEMAGLWRCRTETDRKASRASWAAPEFEDRSWDATFPATPFGDLGVKGGGAVWYRQHIRIPSEWKGKPLIFLPGRISGGDDFFFNGVRLDGIKGRYTFRNRENRRYGIPANLVKCGELNTVAVRVQGHAKSCLSTNAVRLQMDPFLLLMRDAAKPGSEIAATSYDASGCQNGRAAEILFRFPATRGQARGARAKIVLKNRTGGMMVETTCPVAETTPNQLEACLRIEGRNALTLYLSGGFEVEAQLVDEEGRQLYARKSRVGLLSYHERDARRLAKLPTIREETPYGKLELVDEIRCDTPVLSEEHPYVQGGYAHGFAWNTPGSPATVEVRDILGKKCREVRDGWFGYRIGRGLIAPHSEYLLRVEYAEDVPRYACMEVQTGLNYFDPGWKNGPGPKDPYDNYPLKGGFGWFDVIVVTHERTYGHGGAEGAPTDNGFWVFFMDKGRRDLPQYKGGPAVSRMKLYRIDYREHSPRIQYPKDAPRRTFMMDWERQPLSDPFDIARYCRLMGYNAVSPCILKWHVGAYWPTKLGYRPSGDRYVRYLDATAKTGIQLIPRIEYGGSLKLPSEAKNIAPNGKIDPCGRYCNWGANILHPETWKDFESLIDELIGQHHKDHPQLTGLLWRHRSDRIRFSYGVQDIELFCRDTAQALPKGDAATLRKWATSGKMADRYKKWWHKKRMQFHRRIADRLQAFRPGMKFYWYNWDTDKYCVQGIDGLGWFAWGNLGAVRRRGGEAVYREHLKRRASRKQADYPKAMSDHRSINWLLTHLYRDVDNVCLFAPVNAFYLADNPHYLDYYRTGSGLAVSYASTYDEIHGRFINPKYECNMTVAAGAPFSMAIEVLSCFHGDPHTLTYTGYTYGRGFAQAHRRFAQAFLSLPASPGNVIKQDDPDLRVRVYKAGNRTFVGVAYKGYEKKTLTFCLHREITRLRSRVDDSELQGTLKDGKMSFSLSSDPMQLHSFVAEP